MATYVLVPGAWLGGWAWRDVAARLRARGHDVYPITLTGLGERVHLARPEVDLETHITDVVNTMQWNDLDDVILAGHSYAGTVITGVADRIPDRIAAARLCRLGPARGRDGHDRSLPARRIGGVAADGRPVRRGLALSLPRVRGAGGRTPALPDSGSENKQRSRLEPRRTHGPHTPSRCASSTRTPRTQCRTGRSLIACDDMRGLIAAGVPQIAAMAAPPWHYLELETGHWPMFSAPDELAEMLDGLVAGREPIGGSRSQRSS